MYNKGIISTIKFEKNNNGNTDCLIQISLDNIVSFKDKKLNVFICDNDDIHMVDIDHYFGFDFSFDPTNILNKKIDFTFDSKNNIKSIEVISDDK